MTEPRTCWKVWKLRQRAGKYLNSPVIEWWSECGVIRARDEDSAAHRAAAIVGGNVVRVEPVDEFYRPESLQP
ncbi:MAG: hypothetical protein ABI925_11335 [Verrucomicrobiota bacterium]